MTDKEWYELVKDGQDEGWKLVWEKVVEPESTSLRSAEMMKRYSLTAGDLMGMLFHEMIGRKKIELFRGEGSFAGWLKRYVRGYVLNADPNQHGEISIENAHAENVEPGSVSPFGLINDTENGVHLFLDENIKSFPTLSFHPNDCRGTVVITLSDFLRYLSEVGNTYEFIKLY